MATKRKYHVGIQEVHVSTREVEAESPEQAKELAGDLGTEVLIEYNHTMSEDTWSVEVLPREVDQLLAAMPEGDGEAGE